MSKKNLIKTLAQQAKQRMKIQSSSQNYGFLPNSVDEELYQKVSNILSQADCVYNPIGKIIDKGKYESLKGMQKELYFFEMIEKYNMCRERFERERKIL